MKIGDVVNISTTLATITQNRLLEVKIPIPLEKGPRLRQGLPVELMNAQGQTLATTKVFLSLQISIIILNLYSLNHVMIIPQVTCEQIN
jgi:hypothetical protein